MAGALRALYGQANGAELFLLHMGFLSLFYSLCWNGFVILFCSFCQESGSLHFLATCIKSIHILLHANQYSRLQISHCMQLGNYLNVFSYSWTCLCMVYNHFEKECIKHFVALRLQMSWEVGIHKQLNECQDHNGSCNCKDGYRRHDSLQLLLCFGLCLQQWEGSCGSIANMVPFICLSIIMDG